MSLVLVLMIFRYISTGKEIKRMLLVPNPNFFLSVSEEIEPNQ